MAAYFETGFSVRQPMWHGQGSVLADYPIDWDDARIKAGLTWEPTYADLYVQRTVPPICRTCTESDKHALDCTTGAEASRLQVEPSDFGPLGSVPIRPLNDDAWLVHVPTEGHQAIVRDDTWAVLATPTDKFQLIYHSQMGELLDAYSESWRKAGASVKFETAGSIRGGAMVWALVWLDEPFTVPGDESPTYPFAALLNAHDGSAACKLLPTNVRIVCWNTWKAAEYQGDRTGNQIVLRHSGNVSERLDAAKESLSSMRDEAKEWQLVAADLASVNVSDAVFATFLDEFIPIPENSSERTRNQRNDRRELFRKLYMESPTQDGIRGTGYGLVQAAGEYLDHLRPYRNADTYLARTLFTPEPIKGGVIKLVRELTNTTR